MRKLLIIAIVAGVALGGVAACASGTPAASPSLSSSAGGPSSGTSASPGAADATADVCTQAIALEKANGATVLTKVQQYVSAIAAGQRVDSTQVLADLAKIQQDWVTAYNTYLTKPVKPEVKTALQNFVTFVQSIGQDTAQTIPQITAKFNELDQALTTACA